MPEFTIECCVHVDSLTILRDVLGQRFPVEVEDARWCEVVFPATSADFAELRAEAKFPVRFASVSGDGSHVDVTFLKVSAGLEAPEPLPADNDGTRSKESYDWERTLVNRGQNVAVNAVLRLVLIARAEGQYWLAGPGERPKIIGRTTITDPAGTQLTDPRLRWANESFSLKPVEGVLDADALAAAIRGERFRSRSWELLADAKYYALAAPTRHFGLGVVFGAMACEVGIKDHLQERASPEQAALVEVVINKPREVTLAAVDLFNTGLRAVTGRSLKDDDSKTFKLLQRLFEMRNAHVHRAAPTPDLNEVREVLEAATTALEYLRAG